MTEEKPLQLTKELTFKEKFLNQMINPEELTLRIDGKTYHNLKEVTDYLGLNHEAVLNTSFNQKTINPRANLTCNIAQLVYDIAYGLYTLEKDQTTNKPFYQFRSDIPTKINGEVDTLSATGLKGLRLAHSYYTDYEIFIRTADLNQTIINTLAFGYTLYSETEIHNQIDQYIYHVQKGNYNIPTSNHNPMDVHKLNAIYDLRFTLLTLALLQGEFTTIREVKDYVESFSLDYIVYDAIPFKSLEDLSSYLQVPKRKLEKYIYSHIHQEPSKSAKDYYEIYKKEQKLLTSITNDIQNDSKPKHRSRR